MNDHFPPVRFRSEASTGTQRTLFVFALAEGPDLTVEGLRSGTSGVLLNCEDPHQLLQAIGALGRGETPSPDVACRRVILHVQETPAPRSAMDRTVDLSPREREVLTALVDGLSYKMIAFRLSISYETVRTHIKRIYEKLRVHNNTEAVAKALRYGLLA
jgi:DNA-binding NarL/FixJ family response regulator